MHFENFTTNYDRLPIVLIDNSSSTSSNGTWNNIKCSVLQYEKIILFFNFTT